MSQLWKKEQNTNIIKAICLHYKAEEEITAPDNVKENKGKNGVGQKRPNKAPLS